MNPLQIGLGGALAAAIALLAYWAGALSRSGATAAFVVGTLTFGFGGLLPAILLVAFFVSSSALSRFGRGRKKAMAEKFAKGSTRDAAQVAANGGAAAILSLLFGWQGSELWLAGLLGALAAVTADTWATELGVLARSQPRRLSDWRQVSPGTSGAITFEGTLASAAGALFIGGLAAAISGRPLLALAGLVAGLGGALIDSLLGASVQANYYCPQCAKETEQAPIHSCGTETTFVGGWRWMTNDAVNGLASLAGAVLAVIVTWVGG